MQEQRVHERVPCRFRTLFLAGHAPMWWSATVADISLHGLRLKTYRPLDRGTMLEVDLSLPELRPARVVHLMQEENEGYRVGCAFLRDLSVAEFEELQRQAAERGGFWKQSE